MVLEPWNRRMRGQNHAVTIMCIWHKSAGKLLKGLGSGPDSVCWLSAGEVTAGGIGW